MHPKYMKTWAKHYKTGEPIPDSLIQKIDAAAKFNQGFITLELIAAALLDMEWHMLTDTKKRNAIEFEETIMTKIGMIKEILPRYSS
jgi:peptidyl-dipeptidase Dcp